MHNQDIDHLYSLALAEDAGTQQFGQFGINSIRMKASIGIAGEVSLNISSYNYVQAFKSGQICDDQSKIISEEKDASKLKFDGTIDKIVAVPVLDRQNGLPLAVISLYNPKVCDNDTLLDLS